MFGGDFPHHNTIFLLCGGIAGRNLVKDSCQCCDTRPTSCQDGYDDERDKGGHRRTEGGVGQRGLASQVRASTPHHHPPPSPTLEAAYQYWHPPGQLHTRHIFLLKRNNHDDNDNNNNSKDNRYVI